MNIYEITGRHVDISDAMRSYVTERLDKVERLSDDIVDAKVVISFDKNGHSADPAKVEVQLNLPHGNIVRAEERSSDAYAAVDTVAEKLERQLKRHTGRRKGKRRQADLSGSEELPPDDVFEDDTIAPEEYSVGTIARVKKHVLRPMTPDDAAFQMESLGHSFYMFRNSHSGEINVVYMRYDGSYGLLEPAN